MLLLLYIFLQQLTRTLLFFFFTLKLRYVLIYYRIEFRKIHIEIDAAEHPRNSILPEISCCMKPDIDLTERKIAAGVSERVNWVAMSFNKVETTIFTFRDNRVLQCNARIANREIVEIDGKRKRERGKGYRNEIYFRHFPLLLKLNVVWIAESEYQVSYYAHHWSRNSRF